MPMARGASQCMRRGQRSRRIQSEFRRQTGTYGRHMSSSSDIAQYRQLAAIAASRCNCGFLRRLAPPASIRPLAPSPQSPVPATPLALLPPYAVVRRRCACLARLPAPRVLVQHHRAESQAERVLEPQLLMYGPKKLSARPSESFSPARRRPASSRPHTRPLRRRPARRRPA